MARPPSLSHLCWAWALMPALYSTAQFGHLLGGAQGRGRAWQSVAGLVGSASQARPLNLLEDLGGASGVNLAALQRVPGPSHQACHSTLDNSQTIEGRLSPHKLCSFPALTHSFVHSIFFLSSNCSQHMPGSRRRRPLLASRHYLPLY